MLGRRSLDDVGSVQNGTQRIAEFVGQHGQECFRLFHGFARLCLGALLRGDVTSDMHTSDQPALQIVKWRHGDKECAAHAFVVDFRSTFLPIAEKSGVRTKRRGRVDAVDYLVTRPADQILGCVSESFGERPIGSHHAMLRIQDHDQVGDRIECALPLVVKRHRRRQTAVRSLHVFALPKAVVC